MALFILNKVIILVLIREYISALSNSATLCGRTKGYLVWGIQDETHEIIGTEFQYRKMKKGNEELEVLSGGRKKFNENFIEKWVRLWYSISDTNRSL